MPLRESVCHDCQHTNNGGWTSADEQRWQEHKVTCPTVYMAGYIPEVGEKLDHNTLRNTNDEPPVWCPVIAKHAARQKRRYPNEVS